MSKKVLLGLLILLSIGAVWIWFNGGSELYALQRGTSPETAPQDYALQDDSRVTVPAQQSLVSQPCNSLKNMDWGDLAEHATSYLDEGSALGLRRALEKSCTGNTGAGVVFADLGRGCGGHTV